MEVRPGDAGDLEAIAETARSLLARGLRQPAAAEHLDSLSVEQLGVAWAGVLSNTNWPTTGTFALTDTDAIIGFAHVCPSRDEDAQPRTGELTAIYLRSPFWGRGGDRALMAAVLATLNEAACEGAALWVPRQQRPRPRFYEAGGWQRDDIGRLGEIGGERVREVRCRRSPLRPSVRG